MKSLLLLLSVAAWAQTPTLKLTLEEAREMALRNHPLLAATSLNADAAAQIAPQVRAALAPQVSGGIVGSGANDGGRLAIANLNSPLLISRIGAGVQVSQLLTDFGRTSLLADAAVLRANGQREAVRSNRLQVLIAVDRAFYLSLRSRQLVRVAEQTIRARQLVVDQVSALADSQLRSTLDVSFAKVNLSDAQLFATRARNELAASEAELAAALGLRERPSFDIADRPVTERLPSDLEALVAQALVGRPELRQIALEIEALGAQLRSEQRLSQPTVSLLGSVGTMPAAQGDFPRYYSAAGVSVSIPILNGKLFSARQTETTLRTRALEKAKQDRENQIARDVRLAYLNAQTGLERLRLTEEFQAQTRLSLDLAQTRYDLGLSTIVELSTAQLNQTAADVASTSARYDFQILRSILKYQLSEAPL